MAYSTVAGIRKWMRQVQVGEGRADPLTSTDVAAYQDPIDNMIDSMLGSIYQVPLVQVTRNGATAYPDPIPLLANRMVAGFIIHAVYSEIEPNISEMGTRIKEDAEREFLELINGLAAGSQRLLGQRIKARNRFARPTVVPSPVPGRIIAPAPPTPIV